MCNRRAFLDMIAWSEIGPKLLAESDDGYNVLVGGALFNSYDVHPRIKVEVKPGLVSTAAGRYQILARYYDAYKAQLGLQNFGHVAQDLIAYQMIRERSAIPLIDGGSIADAIRACSNIWASLPGNSYGQNTHTVEDLLKAYAAAGGTVSA